MKDFELHRTYIFFRQIVIESAGKNLDLFSMDPVTFYPTELSQHKTLAQNGFIQSV